MRPRLTYANVVSSIALFLVLTGGAAYALDGSNTVFSDDIVNGEVKNADLGADSVGSGKIIDGQVKNNDLGPGASSSNTIADGGVRGIDVANNSLTGADVDEDTLVGGPTNPTGPAGGDLTGTYPNPLIRSNAVGGGKVANNSLTGADIDESTLSEVGGGCAFGYDIGTSTNIPPDDSTPDNPPAATVASYQKRCAGAVRGSFTSEISTATAGDFIHLDMRATCTATGGFANPCTVGQQAFASPGHTFLQNVQAGAQTHAMDMIWQDLPAGVWTFEVLPGGNNRASLQFRTFTVEAFAGGTTAQTSNSVRSPSRHSPGG